MARNVSFFSLLLFLRQNLLTSEQSYIILKSITKLPIDLAPTYYPTLLTIIWENPEAEAILGRDFDIQVSFQLLLRKPSLLISHFLSLTDAERIREVSAGQEKSAPALARDLN